MRSLALIFLIGCAPQDAEVTGNWFTWLAANSSGTVEEANLETLVDKATVYECKRGWDPDAGDWQDGYVGPREGDDPTDDKWVGGDCSPEDSDCTEEIADAMEEECKTIKDLETYTFLKDDGYYAVRSAIEPWRSEALLNSEGDFQLTLHQDLGNGEDFRFEIIVDPDFAPVVCVEDGSGNPVIEYVDGANWVDEWSADEDGYRIHYLNAGMGQAISDTEVWYLPSDWISGYSFAKFSADEFNSSPGAFFDAKVDRNDLENELDDFVAYGEGIEEYAVEAAYEISHAAGANIGGEGKFFHKVETNEWRAFDRERSGLDGWVEMHQSWLRIKDGSKMEEGGKVEGDFQVMYLGTESTSVVVVQGTFSVESLRVDKWGYPVLEDQLREEHGTPYCGGAAMP